jgi:predicted  nucleic acid-binding Zn-ribbon protein
MNIRIDHYHHVVSSAAADAKLDEVLTRLIALQAQGERLMSKATDIQQLVTDINTATNEVASDLQRLRDQIAGGLSADEATTVVTQLDALKNRLTVLGQDPENPVPPAA